MFDDGFGGSGGGGGGGDDDDDDDDSGPPIITGGKPEMSVASVGKWLGTGNEEADAE